MTGAANGRTAVGVVAILAAGAASAPLATAAPSVVWVQAGHESPGEPGYRDQTGTGSGPFGGEVGFTTRVAATVVARLRAAGVDARHTPALVTPWGARGAVFISIHHDAPGGGASVGYAVHDPDRGENWYHGEGSGTASAVPYADSAPHRRATDVTRRVEFRSRALARAVSTRFASVFTPGAGARTRYGGVVPRDGNVRMMHFYGYYRTRSDARMLIECGAGGADDAFLSRTGLIGGAITAGILDHLRARGLMR